MDSGEREEIVNGDKPRGVFIELKKKKKIVGSLI